LSWLYFSVAGKARIRMRRQRAKTAPAFDNDWPWQGGYDDRAGHKPGGAGPIMGIRQVSALSTGITIED
jgi:hypothetical protein